MTDEEDDGLDLTPEQRELARRIAAERDNVHKFDPARRRKKSAQTEVVTEQSVALAFTAANKDRFRYNHDRKLWLIWDRHRWREDGKQAVLTLIDALCRATDETAAVQKASFAAGVERIARRREEFATVSSDWDTDPFMLGTPGGTIDLVSGNLRPGLPQDMIAKAAAITPAETAECPRWTAFLEEALGGKTDNIAFLQRFCGYALTGSTKEEMLLFIAGKPGTGKGTATKTIVAILGDYSLNVPPTMFTDVAWRQLEYYRAQLVSRRLILASEPEKGAVWGDAFVNELTGGDRISARNPAGLPFDYDPTFKLAFQGEQVPDLKAVSTGLKRRLGLLPFDHPPEKPDPNLKDALRAEYPGILRWMIDGCLEWQKTGLAPPPDVKAAVEDYFEFQDVIGRWIEDCCAIIPSARTPLSQLCASYNKWAEDNYEPTMSGKTFGPAIRHKFPVRQYSGKRHVCGLGFRAEPVRNYRDDE